MKILALSVGCYKVEVEIPEHMLIQDVCDPIIDFMYPFFLIKIRK